MHRIIRLESLCSLFKVEQTLRNISLVKDFEIVANEAQKYAGRVVNEASVPYQEFLAQTS